MLHVRCIDFRMRRPLHTLISPMDSLSRTTASSYTVVGRHSSSVVILLCFWPWGLAHFAFSRNIYPVGDNALSPYERKFQEGPFPGVRVPFMARIRFTQLPPIADSKETHRLGPTKVWGVCS